MVGADFRITVGRRVAIRHSYASARRRTRPPGSARRILDPIVIELRLQRFEL
jgi:hypothetical protein